MSETIKTVCKTSDRIAEILKREKTFVSGESIAAELGMSRASIWKGIRELEKNGMTIEAVTKKGYMLAGEKYARADYVLKYLKNPLIRIKTLRSVNSTNAFLKSIAENENEGLLVIADSQTGGKGRLGRTFLSPDGTGLYMSLLLKPKLSANDALAITSCAAVAVCDVARKIAPDKSIGIKWVNDIYANGKKICGILTEAAFNMENGGLDYAVLGIGINLFEPEHGFGELSDIAGALFPYSANTADVKCRIAAEITDRFMELYSDISSKSFFKSYKNNLFILGKKIKVLRENKSKIAEAVDIDDNFMLLVRYENGEEELLSSGEISIRI